jgi:hypothetical protein
MTMCASPRSNNADYHFDLGFVEIVCFFAGMNSAQLLEQPPKPKSRAAYKRSRPTLSSPCAPVLRAQIGRLVGNNQDEHRATKQPDPILACRLPKFLAPRPFV